EPQREIRHETVHTPHSVPAGGDQRRTWDTHGRTVAGPRRQRGSHVDCPELGKYGISWGLLALKKMSPILAKSISSTPLTAVKLKETLPDFGTRQVHELCWLDCSAIFTPTAKRLRQPSSMRGAPASAASSFSVTMSGTVRTPASSSIPSCARARLARWRGFANMMALSPAGRRGGTRWRRKGAAGAVALLGNHDAAIAGGPTDMNPVAAEAIEWTRPRLNSTQREFLARLPLTFEDDGQLFVHASAHTPERWEYIADKSAALRSFMATDARFTFCGHVHVPELFHLSSTGKLAGFQPVEAVEIPLLANRRWLAVLGSVGQPRDYDPAACYGALEVERNVLTYVRVPYDNETAARKVRAAGLPTILSQRLIEGA